MNVLQTIIDYLPEIGGTSGVVALASVIGWIIRQRMLAKQFIHQSGIEIQDATIRERQADVSMSGEMQGQYQKLLEDMILAGDRLKAENETALLRIQQLQEEKQGVEREHANCRQEVAMMRDRLDRFEEALRIHNIPVPD